MTIDKLFKDKKLGLKPESKVYDGISCGEVKDYLVDYIGNDLDQSSLMTKVGGHLDECKFCTALYSEITKPMSEDEVKFLKIYFKNNQE